MNIHELALHYCDMLGIMCFKIASKYEARRFAISVDADVLTVCRHADTTMSTG